MVSTLRKDSKIKLSYFSGALARELAVDIVSLRPLQVRVEESEFALLRREVTSQTFVDLRDARLDETLMTAQVERFAEGGLLRLKRLDENEQRQYVRVSVWLDFEHSVLLPGADDDVLFKPEDVDLGPLSDAIKGIDPQAIARSEDASAGMLYLIRAVQAIDAKLDALTNLTRQMIERANPSDLERQKVSLSGSGLRFCNVEPYDPGTLLKLRFRFTLRRVFEVSALAEVVRSEELPGRDSAGRRRFAVACRFDRLRSEDRERIVAFALHRQREAIRRLNDAVEGF